jgi:hypothetical protein
MPREKPMVAGEVLGSVLTLAILSYMQIFDNPSASGFRSLEMGIHVFKEHSQALSSESQLRGSGPTRTSSLKHDPRVTEKHLCSVDWAAGLAIAVVFSEPERFAQPSDGFGHVRIDDVRQDSVGGYGAIRYHWNCLLS